MGRWLKNISNDTVDLSSEDPELSKVRKGYRVELPALLAHRLLHEQPATWESTSPLEDE